MRQRFGAVGKKGSIALVERFIRPLKDETLRRVLLPWRRALMQAELAAYRDWYNMQRPHRSLGGAT